MTGAMLIPAFTVNADTKIAINEKNFPDTNFRKLIKGDIAYDYMPDVCYDIDKDGYLSSDEIKKIDSIWCHEIGIKDLTGIELFTELEELHAFSNEITKVDLSKNTKLKELYIEENELTKLDLSKNTNLRDLTLEVFI